MIMSSTTSVMSSLTSRSLASLLRTACFLASALRSTVFFVPLPRPDEDLEDAPFFARFAPAEEAFAEELFPAEEDFRVPLPERTVPPEPALPEELLPVFFVLVFVLCAMKLPVYIVEKCRSFGLQYLKRHEKTQKYG